MKRKSFIQRLPKLGLALVLGSLLLALPGAAVAQEPGDDVSAQAVVGTAFSYQGHLSDGGSPAEGSYDFEFKLYDTASSGAQVGSTVTRDDVSVSDGLFSVELDFGSGIFTGEARWLEIGVRPGSSSGAYTTLSPRQPLSPVPYALALPGLWTQQNDTSPNLIGGYNYLYPDVVGATVSGGGGTSYPDQNKIFSNYGTIGGGQGNLAGSPNPDFNYARGATVGGGEGNWANGQYATVGGGGGYHDEAEEELGNRASGAWATVGGGVLNVASGESATVCGGGAGVWDDADPYEPPVFYNYGNRATGDFATVGGGKGNQASGNYATIPGGNRNVAQGIGSFAAGNDAKAHHDGTFVWADNSLGVGFDSTGPDQFLVRANGGVRLVQGASTFQTTWATLQVENARADGGEAAWLRIADADNTRPVVKLLKQETSNGNFMEGVDQTGTVETRQFHINSNGTFVAGSDFAEALSVVGDTAGYEPGDVLVISTSQPGAVEKCSRPYDGAVIGVYSTRPGFLGADKAGVTEVGPDEIPVAVVGIVPVKVSAENGPIYPGDLLTTAATPGHAMKASPITVEGVTFYPSGVLIGKALEGLEVGTGLIKMLVTLQ